MEKELKEKTKTVLQLVRSLDEKRSKCKTITTLFGNDIRKLHEELVDGIESIMVEDFEKASRKVREILWRKVYYDPISTSKQLYKKFGNELSTDEATLLNDFINNAIIHYKTLILKFEDIFKFNLDLRHIIDFGIIENGSHTFEKRCDKEIYTTKEINHALETIHCFLISLGDLHRYRIDFMFDVNNNNLAANYYYEAFKLNPKNGMPHNQLGTLARGNKFEIEAIFHYLYAICCQQQQQPGQQLAELSETNVNKIFQKNIESLEHSQEISASSSGGDTFLRGFMQQFILVIDIFFYDKEIDDFNTLCYSILVGFKEYFIKCDRNSQHDVTFQITSILMLCFYKLRANSSPRVHSLNAFILALCAKIVDKITETLQEYDHENQAFLEMYEKSFLEFEKEIRCAREVNARLCLKSNTKTEDRNSYLEKSGNESNNCLKEGLSLSQNEKVKIAKRSCQQKPLKQVSNNRRRRKRRSSSSNETETESLCSDGSLNSDFDSLDEDEEDDYLRFSSNESESEDDNCMTMSLESGEDFLIENEEVVYKSSPVVFNEKTIDAREDQEEEVLKLLKMKYKRKYAKTDPNLILQFCQKYSSLMKSIKILFDWLRINTEILLDCYGTNPEFIKKVMNLINIINIDIFTRKIYFDRSMITFKSVRENLRSIFDSRHQIPTSEDIVFKKFQPFDELQQSLDWELNYKLKITADEDVIIRTFKIIDFGFFLCKQKKFNYNFCARSRIFIEKKCMVREKSVRRNQDNMRVEKKRRNRNRKRRNRIQISECERLSNNDHQSQDNHQQEEFPMLPKGYLRTREMKSANKSNDEKNEMMGKMGKLWLKNEIQTLESNSKELNTNMTPYLMVDTLALVNYLSVVKYLVKSKKFVVLIPKAVLQDMDGLKKSKEEARNAIKWLETEFKKGNRFLRTQRDHESLSLPLLKVPTKLERDDSVFMNLLPFINFTVSANSNNLNNESDLPVLTLLTGDNLDTRKSTGINQAGILQSIPVNYEHINRFYTKCKK